jgi:hypothetical protein
MASSEAVTKEAIEALVGHEFAGGTYTIEHWENFLLTECTGSQLMSGGGVHPVALFHVPIIGSGTSIAEMFALGQAESDFSISIESYDWEIFQPLKEEYAYQVSGQVISAERRQNQRGQDFDRIQFRFEMVSPGGELVARTTIIWHYSRRVVS